MPITVCGFIFLRFLFYSLFHFKISKLFRKFGLWGFLFIILFDGNIQQFSFYLNSDWKHLFFLQCGHKMLKVIVFLFGFTLIIVSVGGYFITLFLYNKANKYLMDNNMNKVSSASLLIFQNGIRNLLLGFVHYHLRSFTEF